MRPFDDIPLDKKPLGAEAVSLLPKELPHEATAAPAAPPAPPARSRIVSEPDTENEKSSAGSIVGIVIIVLLLAVGAFYFWGAHLNAASDRENGLPLIPPDNSGSTSSSTSGQVNSPQATATP